jgi:hypothetical protein
MYRDVEVRLHAVLSSPLNGVLFHALTALTHKTVYIHIYIIDPMFIMLWA